MKLGELLLAEGVISPTDLSQTLRHARHTQRRLGDLLIEQGFLSSAKLKRVLGVQTHLPYKNVTPRDLWSSWKKYFSPTDLRDGLFLPVGIEFHGHHGESAASIHIACVGAPNEERLAEIERLVRQRVSLRIHKVIFFSSHPEKSMKAIKTLFKEHDRKGAWFLDEADRIRLEIEVVY